MAAGDLTLSTIAVLVAFGGIMTRVFTFGTNLDDFG
jgi:hypothetical protein